MGTDAVAVTDATRCCSTLQGLPTSCKRSQDSHPSRPARQHGHHAAASLARWWVSRWSEFASYRSCEIFDTSHADLADGNEVISVMAIARPTDDADNLASDLYQITSDDGQEITTAPVCLSEMFEIAFEDDRFDSVARVPLESDDDVAVCAAGAFLGASVASVGTGDLDDEKVCLPSVVPEVVLPEVMPEVSIGETANDFGEKPNQLAFINQALETAVALIAKVDKHSDDFMVLKEIISTGQALRNEISHMSLNSDTFQARATNLSIKLLTLNTSMAGPLREGWNSAKSKEGVEYYWPESDPAAVTWTKPGQEMR
jgi:hypothetical protein